MNEVIKIRDILLKRFHSIGLLKVIALEILEGSANELPEYGVSKLEYADAFVRLAYSLNKMSKLKSRIAAKPKNNEASVGIICPIPIELNSVVSRMKNSKQITFKSISYHKGYFRTKDKSTLSVVAATLPEYGNLPSSNILHAMLSDWEVEIICVIGIAGGLKEVHKKLRKGDILIPDQVLYYEVIKERTPPKYIERVFRTSDIIRQHIKETESDPKFEPFFSRQIIRHRPSGSQLYPARIIGKGLASGEKLIDKPKSRIRSRLVSSPLSITATDMDSAGVIAALESMRNKKLKSPEIVILRSISDYADGTKNKKWQLYCTDVAAAYFGALAWFGVFNSEY